MNSIPCALEWLLPIDDHPNDDRFVTCCKISQPIKMQQFLDLRRIKKKLSAVREPAPQAGEGQVKTDNQFIKDSLSTSSFTNQYGTLRHTKKRPKKKRATTESTIRDGCN